MNYRKCYLGTEGNRSDICKAFMLKSTDNFMFSDILTVKS